MAIKESGLCGALRAPHNQGSQNYAFSFVTKVIYRLEQGRYVQQMAESLWMPEIGLGIGRGAGLHEGIDREWLYWFDQQGDRYPAPVDVMTQERQLRFEMQQRWLAEQQARQEAERLVAQEQQARQEAEQQLQDLLERLRQQGIDPELFDR